MDKRELTCIGCPLGCLINVELEHGEVLKVTGYTCRRGEQYARKEVTNPTRIVTTTVRVKNGELPVVSVKTSQDIPKDRIKDCIAALKDITAAAPIRIGDVILAGAAGLDCNILATKDIEVNKPFYK